VHINRRHRAEAVHGHVHLKRSRLPRLPTSAFHCGRLRWLRRRSWYAAAAAKAESAPCALWKFIRLYSYYVNRILFRRRAAAFPQN